MHADLVHLFSWHTQNARVEYKYMVKLLENSDNRRLYEGAGAPLACKSLNKLGEGVTRIKSWKG